MGSASRNITWEGFANARDLGGLPTRDGRVTRSGLFFRSADLRFVTSAGWQMAAAAGLRTILDLRNDDEIRRHAGEQPDHGGGSGGGAARQHGPGRGRLGRHRGHRVLAVPQPRTPQRDPAGFPAVPGPQPGRCAAVVNALAEAVKTLFAALGEPDQGPRIEADLAERDTTARDAILTTLIRPNGSAYGRLGAW
jgi:protein-tyrosine phosphatase